MGMIVVRVLDALNDLHDLLDDYAPSWYTREHRDKAESAIAEARKLGS